MRYGEILDKVGSFGLYQKWLCFMVSYAAMSSSFVTYMFVYIHHVPEFRCKIPDTFIPEYHQQNITLPESSYNDTIPWIVNEFGVPQSSSCEMYNVTAFNTTPSQIVPCQYQYNSSYEGRSVAMEFDLVCDNGWKPPFAVSLYMAGMMFGSTSGKLSDRYGRRPVFLVATLLLYITIGLLGFAWNFESYAAGCFFCGTFNLINYIATYVLSLEMVSPEYRNFVGIINYLGTAIGGLIVPLFGYFLRDWRWYIWVNCMVGVIYIPLYWLLPESVRWLIMIGKEDEARAQLMRMAKMNGRKVDVSELVLKNVDLADGASFGLSHVNLKQESSLLFVLRHAQLRPRYFTLYLGWFVCSMTYYGISLNPSNLSGDRFLNLFLIILVELPSLVVVYLAVKFIGIPRSFLLFMMIAGAGCMVAPFMSGVSSEATTFVVLISKGAITAGFFIVYLGTLEISPTLVRNAGTSIGSFFARLGSILSPYLIHAGSLGMIFLPYLIMGVLAMISGFLGILFTPETNGVEIPDTVQDALKNTRYYRLNICKKFPKEIDYKQKTSEASSSLKTIRG